jgi:hypothetical protein
LCIVFTVSCHRTDRCGHHVDARKLDRTTSRSEPFGWNLTCVCSFSLKSWKTEQTVELTSPTPPPAHPLAHPTSNRIASSETMNSAALRSRTTKHGGEDGDDTAGPAPVLDTDAQEALVLELERDARRQATIWRRVFGALSIAWGVYFLDCAAHAASGDVTRAWSGVRRPRTPHERPSSLPS